VSVAAWEHIKNTVGDLAFIEEQVSMRSLSAQTEIVATFHNGSAWTGTQISENDLLDMIPAVAAGADGRATVVWTRGAIDEVDMEADAAAGLPRAEATSELVYSTYDGSKWSGPSPLYAAQDGQTITSYHVARGVDGSFIVALSLYGSGDMEQVVYVYVNSSGEKSIISAPMNGINPQVVFADGDYYTAMYSKKAAGVDFFDHDIWFGKFSKVEIYEDETDFAPSSSRLEIHNMHLLNAPSSLGTDFRFTAAADSFNNLGIAWPSVAVDENGDASLALQVAKIYQSGGNYGLSKSIF
jgi:hypothetical protein